jgi:hypothetical protein
MLNFAFMLFSRKLPISFRHLLAYIDEPVARLYLLGDRSVSRELEAVVAEYVDHDSGSHSRRTHFEQMFADARARKFELVLFGAWIGSAAKVSAPL